ncbi:MAG: DUF1027 domain-containing protein [bacterium]|nr:DUF1027 domain-containing protein [bacterium]
MEKIMIDNNTYNLIINYKNGFNQSLFTERYTDYFADFDYIVGDIAYNKLRLKGFYDNNNPKVKAINNYNKLKEYLDKNCATECQYFVLKKID